MKFSIKSISVLSIFFSISAFAGSGASSVSGTIGTVVALPTSSVTVTCPNASGNTGNFAPIGGSAGWTGGGGPYSILAHPTAAVIDIHGTILCDYSIRDNFGVLTTVNFIYNSHIGSGALAGFTLANCHVSGTTVVCNP